MLFLVKLFHAQDFYEPLLPGTRKKYLIFFTKIQMVFSEIKAWRTFWIRRRVVPRDRLLHPDRSYPLLFCRRSTDCLALLCLFIYLVLITLTCNQTCVAYFRSHGTDSCMSRALWAITHRSPGKSISSKRSITFRTTQSNTSRNTRGDNTQGQLKNVCVTISPSARQIRREDLNWFQS